MLKTIQISSTNNMSALIVLGIIAVCIYHIAKRICQDPKAKQQLQQIFKKVEAKATGFAAIADKFTSLEQVSDALRKSGLESSNLIIGMDAKIFIHIFKVLIIPVATPHRVCIHLVEKVCTTLHPTCKTPINKLLYVKIFCIG